MKVLMEATPSTLRAGQKALRVGDIADGLSIVVMGELCAMVPALGAKEEAEAQVSASAL